MANIVDVENAPGNLEELEKNLSEAITAKQDQADDAKAAGDAGDSAKQKAIEDKDPLAGTKFEGKSVEELLESYNNLQSAYGRMANDLGTQRKLTDRLLELKRDEDLQQNTPPEPVKVDAADLLDDPTKALDAYIASREARLRSEYDERLGQFEAQLHADKFMQKHPDFQELAQSEELRQWSMASPVRARVAQAAANGDWDAADALLTEYKTEMASAPKRQNIGDDIEGAKKASLESANQSGSGNSAKIYRRADLIDLKINKPHVYSDPAFQQEILKAYSEGRVK